MTEFAGPGSVASDGLQPTVAAVAKALADRADELVDELEEAVIRRSGLAEVAMVLPHDDVRDASAGPTSGRFWRRWWTKRSSTRHRQRRSASSEPATKRPCQ